MSSSYSISPTINSLEVYNSTTYADVLGLLLGLNRLQGETADKYLQRLEYAARLRRDHPYEGSLNQVTLALGFVPQKYIHLATGSWSIITISIAGVKIDSHTIIPILTFDSDGMWRWRMLSDVVADINTTIGSLATLLVDDGPAFQLCHQSNSQWSIAEPITGIKYQLAFPGVQVGSEKFNTTVPSYTLTSDGVLTFSSEPIANTQITYNYILSPYDVVGSPVSLVGLLDNGFSDVAETPDGALAYQVKEYVQKIMTTDRSYWTK